MPQGLQFDEIVGVCLVFIPYLQDPSVGEFR